MQEVFLGEVIKRRRLELGLTQEQLCEGICEPITISRLENGRQTPSRNRINALLERLDMPADRYFALLSKNELEIESLQKQITAYNVRFAQSSGEDKAIIRKQALQAHDELLSLADKDDMLSRQLIIRSKVILGKEDGPYSLEEQKEMLLEAICVTCPAFDLDEIGNGLYTTDEIKIINQLALVYVYAEEHMTAIEILAQLYKYIKKHFHNIPTTRAHLNMVAFNYATELDAVGQYKKAIEIAEEGRRACLDYGHYLSMPGLLEVMAESYYRLGETAKSADLYYQAYYFCKVIGDHNNLSIIQTEANNYLGIVFDS